MALHIFFNLKRRIDKKKKTVTNLKLALKVGIDFIRGVTNVARSRCTCGCISKEKGSPRETIYTQSSFLKPVLGGRTFI